MNSDNREYYAHKPVKHNAIDERVPKLRGAHFLSNAVLPANHRLDLSCDRKDDSGTKDNVMPRPGSIEPVQNRTLPNNDNCHCSKER